MNAAIFSRFSPSLLFIFAAIFVFILAFFLSAYSLYSVHPELATGITYDLAFFAPLFYYLAIRKSRIPKTTVLGVAAIGLFTASRILPVDQQSHVVLITTYFLPVLELVVISVIAIKVWKTIKVVKRNRNESNEVGTILRNVSTEIFGDSFLSRAAAFEAFVIYFAIIRWRRRDVAADSFTYNKKRRLGPLYGIIAFIIIAEAVALHVLLSQWTLLGAWILTLSSLYVLVLLAAHFKASYLRPIEIINEVLHLRNGLSCDVEIPIDNIVSVEDCDVNRSGDFQQASFLKGFEDINVALILDRPHEAEGLYGFKSSFEKIAFFVDDKDRFVDILSNHGS